MTERRKLSVIPQYILLILFRTLPLSNIQKTAVSPTSKDVNFTPRKTSPKNPYKKPSYTFPSAVCHHTTNKTAGHTPFVNMHKRKIDFNAGNGSIKLAVRKVNKGRLMSVAETMNQNRMWYHNLPDGHLCAWVAKGTPDGPVGYYQPLIHKINNALRDPADEFNEFMNTCDIKALLPIRDESTGEGKLHYYQGTKFLTVQSIVTIIPDITKNGESPAEAWCEKLVQQIGANFPKDQLKVTFGGDASQYGMKKITSLDSQFLTEDVVNLAFMSYQESIMNGSFFEDKDLVGKYFAHTGDVRELFEGFFS